jgi:hypothetical protein
MNANFLLIAMTVLVGAYVLWPLRQRREVGWEFSEEDTPLGRLAVRKEVLLGNIGDLDFEFAMGKLSEEDYRDIRENLKRQTLKIMEQIEVLLDSRTMGSPASAERVVLPSCGGCGGTLPPEARFCPHCGSSLQ